MPHSAEASSRRAVRPAAALLLLPLAVGACAPADPNETLGPPNVLFIVWDTTRADRLSLYGYDRPTTPFLERWAEGARVFEDCVSTGSSTVPSHGGMFTGLLPGEHGANNLHKHLDDRHETLAEIFLANGYRTFCFAANPHISKEENFAQGFEVEEHPWDGKWVRKAVRLQMEKLHPKDRSSGLPERLRTLQVSMWDVKACGELAEEALLDWLDEEPEKPFFAFLNYMEAHRPFLPSLTSREEFMTPEQIELSLTTDRGWSTMWDYIFGLHEYTEAELEAMALTYDACIRDLDRLLESLIGSLEAAGQLENTVVVLVGDHGEHLGEHHMLDHQYSIYQGLIHVPLVLWDPNRVEPGRVREPVSNFDLFPTLLDLAGLEPPAGLRSQAIHLLDPKPDRWRLAEYPSDFEKPIRGTKKRFPDWDPAPFRRRLTALFDGKYKLIWSSDGAHELYDLSVDPNEERDLAADEAELVTSLCDRLGAVISLTTPFDYSDANVPELSAEQRERLEALGYAGGGEEEDEEDGGSGGQ